MYFALLALEAVLVTDPWPVGHAIRCYPSNFGGRGSLFGTGATSKECAREGAVGMVLFQRQREPQRGQ